MTKDFCVSPSCSFTSSEEDESVSSDSGWIGWFCRLGGHDFFAEVDIDYIRDNFNLCGLKGRVKNYECALEMILGDAPDDEDELLDSEFLECYRDLTDLYGLIHARYILSPRGMQQMKEKYMYGAFGHCPRVLCNKEHVLPVGISDELHAHRVRIYCPKCQEAYELSSTDEQSDIDGAYFGTSFPHVLLQHYFELIPLEPPVPYIPKMFGFRVHKRKSIIQIKMENGEYGSSLISKMNTKMLTDNIEQFKKDTNNRYGKREEKVEKKEEIEESIK